jgi:hypothetical protein
MNAMLEVPLPGTELEKIYDSVCGKEWGYKCRDIPCKHYCSRERCAAREFSPLKKKNRHFTGAEYWGEITEVMAAEPYYLWEVKPEGAEEAKKIRVDSVDDLYARSAVQKSCIRYLHWSPYRVSDNDWIKTINTAMAGIEGRKIAVEEGTDTTDLSDLRELFLQFISRRLGKDKQKYMIPMGQVYYEEGVYYFTHSAFKTYLRLAKFNLGKTNLRVKLQDYGCSEAVLEDTVSGGERISIRCWKKEEDDLLRERRLYYKNVLEKDAELLEESREGWEARKEVLEGDEEYPEEDIPMDDEDFV